VDQTAEDLLAPYLSRLQVGDWGCGNVIAVWWPQVPGLVG